MLATESAQPVLDYRAAASLRPKSLTRSSPWNFAGEYPSLLVLAPRKPEILMTRGVYRQSHRSSSGDLNCDSRPPQSNLRNSSIVTIPDDVTVLLLDSIGELLPLWVS